jgi:hypothetical protein
MVTDDRTGQHSPLIEMTDKDDPSADRGEFENNMEHEESNDAEESIQGFIGHVSEQLRSRRDFLSDTAKVGAGAAALGALGTGTAAAAHADEPYSNSPYEDNNPKGYGALTDVQIIKFALLLERLEATFYTEAVGDEPIAEMGTAGSAEGARLGETQVESSDIAKQFANPSIRYSTFQRFKQVRNHEQAHVDALEGVLAALQEEGVEAANPNFASGVEFQFPYETFGEFLDLARAFEDTGAGAYTAAAPAIDEEKYLASAAQILAVEARHASYIRVLNNPLPAGTGALNPFPRAFQQKLSVNTVINRIEPFVVGADADDIRALLGQMQTQMQTFTVTVKNVSQPGLLSTPRAKGAVPLSPGAYAAYTGSNPMFTVGEQANVGTQRIAEDGFPGGPFPPTLESGGLAERVANADNVTESGTFASKGGSLPTPALGPGESAEFTITASEGGSLQFETMFVQSDDWFFAFGDGGLELFPNGEAISGDVTDQIRLYDAGTEVDAPPGEGPKSPPGPVQKPVQPKTAIDVGTDENVPIQLARERHPDFNIPANDAVISVTISPSNRS